MSDTTLALVESDPEKATALIRRATDVAGICRDIVVKTAVTIGKKKYVPVEGWCTIAAAHNCMPSIREVREQPDGIVAICDLKRADGTIVASAEGFVGNDEPTWASRALYARRAMAQTRSISRVCRTAYAYIVTMMDAGLSTTPADEIPHTEAEATPIPRSPAVKVMSGEVLEAGRIDGLEALRIPDNRCKFGMAKNKFLCDLEDKDLAWQLAAALKSVEARDPKWHAANEAWARRVQAEAERRTGK